MKWIDIPVLDILTYFSGTLYYFMEVARVVGTSVALFCIIWNCIRLAFGTLEIQKALVSTIFKFFLFIALLNCYPLLCNTVRNFAIKMGEDASAEAKTTIVSELAHFQQTLETIVENENAEEAANLAIALASVQALKDSSVKNADLQKRYPGYAILPSKAVLEDAEERVREAEAVIDSRKANPTGAMKMVNSIKSILLPLDEEGNVIQSEDNKVDKYILDLHMKVNGEYTGYLSPNSMLRLALLSAQILWEKEWNPIRTEWEVNDEKGFLTKRNDSLDITKFPFIRFFDIILVFACQIGIVLSMVFSIVQYVMCITEFTIIISTSCVLLPCILMDETKEMSSKLFPAIMSQAIKLMMITMCMIFSVYAYLALAMKTISETSGFNLTSFAYVAVITLLTWALTQHAPTVAESLLTGRAQFSMGEFVRAMGTMVAIGGGAVRAAGMTQQAVDGAKKNLAKAGVRVLNKLGDASGILAAGRTAQDFVSSQGGSASQQGMAGLKAMAGEAGYRMKQGMKGNLQDMLLKNGVSYNGPGSSAETESVGHNKFRHYGEYDREKAGEQSMRWGYAKNEMGVSYTPKEFMNKQAEMASDRVRNNLGKKEQGQEETDKKV